MDFSERVEYLFNYALEDLGFWWRSKLGSSPAAPFLIYSGIGASVLLVVLIVTKDSWRDSDKSQD